MPSPLSQLPATPVKSRLIWNDPDGLCWQTRKSVSKATAIARARMFTANPRNANAVAVHVGKGQYAIRIYPATYTGIYKRLNKATRHRLAEQGADLEFELRPDRSALLCRNPHSQGAYQLTRTTCTCPHFWRRTSRVGAACKHLEEAAHRGLLNLLETIEEREARWKREIERDFPL